MQTAEDRERDLWIASQRYVNGEINIDELEKVESIQAERLRSAIITLSRRRVRQRILNRIQGVLKYISPCRSQAVFL